MRKKQTTAPIDKRTEREKRILKKEAGRAQRAEDKGCEEGGTVLGWKEEKKEIVQKGKKKDFFFSLWDS